MKTQVILAAAGRGARLKAKTVKSLIPLKGRPMFLYSLNVFERCPLVDGIILVVPKKNIADFKRRLKKNPGRKPVRVVPGGRRRSDSVRQGLAALDDDTGIVLIHDAARPLVSPSLVRRAVNACRREGAVVTAVPAKSTIKRVGLRDKKVEATLDRRFLWEVQTPQVFRRDVITRAHREFPDLEVTDDASLVEQTGHPVRVLMGSYENVKVTTREDLVMAGALLNGARR